MTADPFVILYVEDDDLTRELFSDFLATPARRIVAVGDGAGARAALREHAVGLLITDISLPDASGLDVAREALERNPRLPVVVCSGHDSAGIVASLGPTAHALQKPIDLAEFESLIERLAP